MDENPLHLMYSRGIGGNMIQKLSLKVFFCSIWSLMDLGTFNGVKFHD